MANTCICYRSPFTRTNFGKLQKFWLQEIIPQLKWWWRDSLKKCSKLKSFQRDTNKKLIEFKSKVTIFFDSTKWIFKVEASSVLYIFLRWKIKPRETLRNQYVYQNDRNKYNKNEEKTKKKKTNMKFTNLVVSEAQNQN